jgi:hypothetical protein
MSSSRSSADSVARRAAPPVMDRFREFFTVNMDYPERNSGGIVVVVSPNVVIGTSVIEVIRINYAMTDSRDYDFIKAILNEDGTGFTLILPTAASFQTNGEEVKEMHALDLLDKSEIELQQHQVFATD